MLECLAYANIFTTRGGHVYGIEHWNFRSIREQNEEAQTAEGYTTLRAFVEKMGWHSSKMYEQL
jgi:hypothetical protein